MIPSYEDQCRMLQVLSIRDDDPEFRDICNGCGHYDLVFGDGNIAGQDVWKLMCKSCRFVVAMKKDIGEREV